jgi:hypothetical protein
LNFCYKLIRPINRWRARTACKQQQFLYFLQFLIATHQNKQLNVDAVVVVVVVVVVVLQPVNADWTGSNIHTANDSARFQFPQ